MHPPSMRVVLLEIGDRRPLKRRWYIDEIVRSIYDPNAHMIVERVLARRRIIGKRMAYVKFRDYVGLLFFILTLRNYNSAAGPKAKMWIEESDLIADHRNITG